MKSMLVIGIGRFGRHLSIKLAELGNEVMVVDKDEAKVTHVAPYVTTAQVADCQDEDVLRELGVANFDVCFVCVSGDFQSSLEITSMLKDMGARHVVSKTDREKQGKFLEKIGADEIVHAEKDMAQRLAVKYSTKNIFDYIELSPDYAIAETLTPKEWLGHSVYEMGIRKKYNVNILGYKNGDGKLIPIMSEDHMFKPSEHLVISGLKKDVANVASRT